MNLVRRLGLFTEDSPRKMAHLGPEKGGTFWSLQGSNDLPSDGPVAVMDLQKAARRGRLFIKNGENAQPDWVEVPRECHGTCFMVFRASWSDDWEAAASALSVWPFMPEFYFLPLTGNGKRMAGRAEDRAYKRFFRNIDSGKILRGW